LRVRSDYGVKRELSDSTKSALCYNKTNYVLVIVLFTSRFASTINACGSV